jgi:hypothetical protein
VHPTNAAPRKIHRKIRRSEGSIFEKFPFELLIFLWIFSWSGSAGAQVHYDVGVLGGFQQRFLVDAPKEVLAEGGSLMIDGHVAVFPLLRVGGWVTGEVSKVLDASDPRGIFSGGVRVKVVSPWPRGVWRFWLGTGFGYDGLVTTGAGGGFFEVPAIVGASYRIRKPFVFLMELQGRFGFGFWGSYYDGRAGTDTVSIALAFGIGIDG